MQLNDQQIVLENEEVLLRPIQAGDVEAIFKATNDERIWVHVSYTLLTMEATAQYVHKCILERQSNQTYTFVITNKKTNEVVGCTSFMDIELQHKRVEIGSTWYNPSVWRSAVNTNCKYLLLTYAFETMQLNRVQIKTGHENIRSQKAIERLGAEKEGILRNHMIKKDGTIRHTVMYSITKEQWPTVKDHFEQRLLKK